MKKEKQRKGNIIKALKRERNSYRDIVEHGKPYFKKYAIPETRNLPVYHFVGVAGYSKFDAPLTEDWIRKEIAYQLAETFKPMLNLRKNDSNPYDVRYESDVYISFGEGDGVLEQIAEKQDSLLDLIKAWDDEIDKYGYVN